MVLFDCIVVCFCESHSYLFEREKSKNIFFKFIDELIFVFFLFCRIFLFKLGFTACKAEQPQ